jgi:hypothetical protein
VYRPPTWLMTGVWMSDSSGFAVTPPRKDSDSAPVRAVGPPRPATGAYERTTEPESELMIARAEPEAPNREAPPTEPRIEQYRER